MSKIYRYRSIESAITKHAEIAKQEIYLASPHEMNDPNEGVLNMSWNADAVAWDGLLDHFVRTSAITQGSSPSEQEMSGGVILPGHHNLTQQAEGFAQDISDLPEIREAKNTTAANLYGTTSDVRGLTAALESLNEKVHQTLRLHRFNGAALIPLVYETSNGRSIPRFRFPPTPPEWAWQLPRLPHTEVPALYVAKMSEVSIRPWYAACFSKTFQSQAMWHHYGQARSGICLEFETELLKLEEGELVDVLYEGQLPEIEFFPYVTRLTELEYRKIFRYQGRTSCITPDFSNEDQRLKWHQEIDNRTKQIALTKTDDWSTEEEVRLLKMDLLDKGPRAITYPSKALTGIIFGERASDETKDAVRSVMISKHRHSPLGDFLLFDAVTHPNGRVERRPSAIQFFDI